MASAGTIAPCPLTYGGEPPLRFIHGADKGDDYEPAYPIETRVSTNIHGADREGHRAIRLLWMQHRVHRTVHSWSLCGLLRLAIA